MYHNFDHHDFTWVESSEHRESLFGLRTLTPQAKALAQAGEALAEARPALSQSFLLAKGAALELGAARSRYEAHANAVKIDFDHREDDVDEYVAEHVDLALSGSYVGIQEATLDASLRVVFTTFDQIIEQYRTRSGYEKALVVGGPAFGDGVTLLECIRMLGNWYRHVHEWIERRPDDANWNLKASFRLGVGLIDLYLPRAVIEMLPFQTYLALEDSLFGALKEVHGKLRPALEK